MADVDDWGQDPSVKSMRRVFSEMEVRQKKLLKTLNISFYDPRLRSWREQALLRFNAAWTKADRLGIAMDVENAGGVYVAAFSRVLQLEGLRLPAARADDNTEIDMRVDEEGS